MFDLEKTHPNFQKKIRQKDVSSRITPKSNQAISTIRGYSCQVLQWIDECFSLASENKHFFLINATAVTMGQGQRKVIQYISPDLYILCPKYVKFRINGFSWKAKVFAVADTAETNWKYEDTPDRVALMKAI